MGTGCCFAGSFPRIHGSEIGGLPDGEIVCGIEMPTVFFKAMSIFHEGDISHHLCCCLPAIGNVLVRGHEMQTAE